jgi:hypothetical protein
MTTTTQGAYGTAATVTATLASLASSTSDVGRETNSVDAAGATPPPVDYMAHFKITTGTSPTAGKQIEIWAIASIDGGTTWEGGATGADAGLTPTTKYVFALVKSIPTDGTSNKTYIHACKSICAVFGSILPPSKFSFFINHNTGVNLNSTAGNHEIKVRPINVASA